MKYLIKSFISILIYFFGGLFLLKLKFKNKYRLVIINYHNFSKYNNYKIKRGDILKTGYSSNFEKQISFLEKHFNFCYLDEFFNGKSKKGINILITFDDGYKDNYDIAMPILDKYNAKAIFFITTNFIGTKNWLWHDKIRYLSLKGILDNREIEHALLKMNSGVPIDDSLNQRVNMNFVNNTNDRLMMNLSEVEGLISKNFKIGSHTHNHKILSFLPSSEQEQEIKNSLDFLNQKFNYNVNTIAYPNGLYNKFTIDLLKKYNFDYGLTTKSGFNTLESDEKTLKRIGVNASDRIPIIIFKLILNSIK